MEQSQHIRFQKTRDFGAKLNATFEFIRQNFKPLAKSILYIAGPAIILFGVFYGYYQKYALDITRIIQGDTIFSGEIILVFGGIVIFGIASQLLLITVVLEFVNIYNEKPPTEITTDEVWSRVKLSIGKVTGAFLLLTIVMVVVFGIIAFLIAGIGVSDSSAGVGIVMLFMFILFPVVMYVMVVFSVFFNIMLHEKHPLSEIGVVMKRSLYLVKNKWWSTLGLLIVAGILRSVMALVFSIPMMIILAVNAFSLINGETATQSSGYDILLILSSVVAMLGSYMLQSIPLLALTFQYFNLVELKEATGLISEIDTLGTTEPEEDIEEGY